MPCVVLVQALNVRRRSWWRHPGRGRLWLQQGPWLPHHHRVGFSVIGRVPGHSRRLGVARFQGTKPPFSPACGRPNNPSPQPPFQDPDPRVHSMGFRLSCPTGSPIGCQPSTVADPTHCDTHGHSSSQNSSPSGQTPNPMVNTKQLR